MTRMPQIASNSRTNLARENGTEVELVRDFHLHELSSYILSWSWI